MAINIQSLFSDIIETPAQRQERMLTEGILKGRELTGGLTGLARTQAPLVSALSMQMPQRQEALRRNVGGMLGLDVRTQSEKLEDIIKTADASTPAGMINLSKAIQEYAPAQALTLRQAAVEQQRELDETARQRARQEAADARAEAADARAEESLGLSRQREARSEASWIQSYQTAEEQRYRARQQEQRTEEERQAYNTRLENVRNELPEDSVYRSLLQGPNVSQTLLVSALESTQAEEPNLQIRNSFDAKTNEPVVMGIDPQTGRIAWQHTVGARKEIGEMTTDQRTRLNDDIEKDPALSKITEETGALWWSEPGVATANDLADLIYRISQQYELSLIEAKNAVKETYQSENGEAKIRSGIIDVSQYTGASSEQPEPSEESVFSEADAILEGVGLSETTPDPNFRMTGVQDAPAEERPTGMDEQIESMIAFNKRMNAKQETIESSVNNILNSRKADLERLETALESQNKMKDFPGFGDEQFIASLEAQIKSLKDTIDYYQNPLELIASR